MAISAPSPIGEELETTDNAWTGAGAIPISPGDTCVARIGAMARGHDNTDCAAWEVRALFRRDGSDPLNLVGSVLDVITPIKTLGAALWDFRVYTNGDEYIYIDVKGSGSQNVGWFLFGTVDTIDYP